MAQVQFLAATFHPGHYMRLVAIWHQHLVEASHAVYNLWYQQWIPMAADDASKPDTVYVEINNMICGHHICT